MSVTEVTEEDFEYKVLNSSKLVLVDFYADWCGPCKMQSPICEEIAKEHPEIKVVKVNVDKNPGLSEEYGVQSIPTLLIMQEGDIRKEFVGLTPKEDILEELED